MKAIVVTEPGEPDSMKLVDAPDPQAGPGQVVVDIRAIGVNPVDTYVRAGRYGIPPPLTPGYDAAGVVESVGQGVAALKPGDRVWVSTAVASTYAEKIASDAKWVHPLTDGFSFAEGAALGVPYGTAYRALFQKAKAQAGETVFIHGASGGVGVAAVELAAAAGITVIGTAGTDTGRRLVVEHGARHALDHTSPGYLDQLRELTGGKGPDVIVEMLANINLQKDLEAAADWGRIVIVGSRGQVTIDPRLTMGKELAVYGLMLRHARPDEEAEIVDGIQRGLETGTVRPVIGREFALADAPAAHIAVMQPGAHGKIVLLTT